MLLQLVVLVIFVVEPDNPPSSGGIFRDLYVDQRRHLVYAYLALISVAPLLTAVCFILRPRRERMRALVQLMVLWVLFGAAVFYFIPKKFRAVATVTWHYVIEPQIDEMEMVIDE